MSDFELKFTLRQHTPLIHFQHDQPGATLRATEVKPKLDDFIIHKLLKQPGDNPLAQLQAHPIWRNWLIGGSEAKNSAFDYKVKMHNPNAQPQSGDTALISRNDIGHWVKYREITVTIFTYHTELKALIEGLYHEFFALTNFGKRQSKGWGSFYPDTKEDDFESILISSGKAVYSMPLRNADQGDAFYRTVSDVWRWLKSGRNNPYMKSLAFKYMNGKGFRWDKRRIKKDINALIARGVLRHNLAGRNAPIDSQADDTGCLGDDHDGYFDWNDNAQFDGEYRFVRAMLGLPEVYEFQTTNNTIHQVSFSNANFQRFKSPVTFKVFRRTLYAIAEPLPQGIYNQGFQTTVKTKTRSGNHITGPHDMPSVLTTPSSNEFDLEKFLDEYFPCVGLNRIN